MAFQILSHSNNKSIERQEERTDDIIKSLNHATKEKKQIENKELQMQ